MERKCERHDMPKTKKIPSEEQVKIRLAGLCARSEQCESDIVRKLKASGLDSGACRRIFDSLREGKFVDDARFARAFASYKASSCGWGPAKIRAGLMAKRISQSIISDALSCLESDIFDAPLMRVAKAKARQLDLSVYADRMKLMRHLASRGYSSSQARRALDKILAES